MRRTLAPLAALAVAGTLSTGTASGALAPFRAAGNVLLPGPALSPAGVLWAESPTDRQTSLTFRAGSGRATRTVLRLPHRRAAAPNDSFFTHGMAQSATRRVLSVGEFQSSEEDPAGGDDVYSVLRIGRPAGPFATTVGGYDDKTDVTDFRLAGDMLVTDETAGGVDRVFLRDLAGHAAARQIGPDGADSGLVAGRFMAYALWAPTTTTIVVIDWRTGAEIYRVSLPYAGDGPRPGVELQQDGTIAVVSRPVSGAPADLGWASVANPALHVIAHDAMFESVLRIADGRILYTRPGVELALASIADGSTRAVSFKTHDLLNADFDGRRLAYATSHCVYLDDLTGPAPTAPPIGTCPQLQLTASIDTYSQPVVKATIGCTSATEPVCPGTAVFRTYPVQGRRPVILKTIRFRVAAGHEKTVRFTLSRLARARLRAFDPSGGISRSVDVQVVATATDSGHVKTVARDDALLDF